MTNDAFEKFLQAGLKRYTPQRDDAAVNRVLHRLAGPLPRQRSPLMQWPTVLLDWQFALAWPRMAALACCLALGFAIGLSGLDRSIDRADAAPADLGSFVFGPEILTGGQP